MKTYENSQPQGSLPMELPSMSLPAASRAKTLALPESSRALGESAAASGPRSCDLLATYDPATSSWRTSQTCLEALLKNQGGGLAEFSGTWPNSGMMRSGKTYQRQPWALPIAESAHGLWPTPTKSDGVLGIPQLNDNPKRGGLSLTTAVFLVENGLPRTARVELRPSSEDYKTQPRLNPEFVEELMGFPIGHSELQPSATPLSPKFPNS